MSRIPYITSENFTDAQKQLCKRITGGKRSQGQPLESFFTNEGAQRLGEVLRFEGTLSPLLRELAILTVAAKWEAHYEWWAHERIGRKYGLDDRVIKSLKAGEPLDFDSPAQALVFAFSRELIESGHISDRLYAKAVELLGEAGVVELVFLLGYYTTVAMILNVFEISIPDGETTPIPKSGHENPAKNRG